MKTFIRRPGNKTRYVKFIAPHLPSQINTYYEPFIGTGAVFLYLEPKKWVINDINTDVFQIWQTVLNNPKQLLKYFQILQERLLSMSEEEKIEYCQKETKEIESKRYGAKRAALFLFMTYIAYVGHIQRNHSFYFPGLHKSVKFEKLHCLSSQYKDNLLNIQHFLKGTKGVIQNHDYKHTLKKAKDGDFVFLDPPYIEDHNYQLNYNNDEELRESFINDLLKTCQELDKRGVKWLMTQANTEIIRKVFKDYKQIKYPVFRGYTNSYSSEIIIKNY
jgi:DNA adenine methylase